MVQVYSIGMGPWYRYHQYRNGPIILHTNVTETKSCEQHVHKRTVHRKMCVCTQYMGDHGNLTACLDKASGLRSMYSMNHPLGVGSTLHRPAS